MSQHKSSPEVLEVPDSMLYGRKILIGGKSVQSFEWGYPAPQVGMTPMLLHLSRGMTEDLMAAGIPVQRLTRGSKVP